MGTHSTAESQVTKIFLTISLSASKKNKERSKILLPRKQNSNNKTLCWPKRRQKDKRRATTILNKKIKNKITTTKHIIRGATKTARNHSNSNNNSEVEDKQAHIQMYVYLYIVYKRCLQTNPAHTLTYIHTCMRSH